MQTLISIKGRGITLMNECMNAWKLVAPLVAAVRMTIGRGGWAQNIVNGERERGHEIRGPLGESDSFPGEN